MNKNTIFEIIGWYGVLAILIAYAMNSFGVLGSETLVYRLLNVSGAFGIVLVSFTKKDYQPMLLNIVWFLIGFLAIIISLL